MSRLRSVAVAAVAVALSLSTAACTNTSEPLFATDPLPQPQPGPAPVVAPTVVQRAPNTAVVPDSLKVTCLTSATDLRPSPTCPVLEWNGKTYWALSYRDNRSSLAMVGYDAAGAPTGMVELKGARYVVSMRVVEADSTVVLVGQASREVTVRWAELP